jgi:hypothetical protein
MYLGWNVCERSSRENCSVLTGAIFPFAKSSAICSATDVVITKFVGVELKEPTGDDGTELEQFKAQHKREASADGDLSLLFALSQHFIILPFGACSGVPETTPPAKVKSRKNNMRRFAINLNIFLVSGDCQSLSLTNHFRSPPAGAAICPPSARNSPSHRSIRWLVM